MQLTDGHKKLRAWLKTNSQTALARRLGVSQAAVSLWTKVGHRPADHHRKALAIVCDIPEPAWLTEKERELLERLSAPAPAPATVAA